MRLRRMLGLAAIGGAIAYAYKKNGGSLDVESIKKFVNDTLADLKQHVQQVAEPAGGAREPKAPPVHDPRASSYGSYSPKSPNGVR